MSHARQESVWDYPRPPRVENCSRRIRVLASGVTIADTVEAKRVLETSHPPTYYIPPGDVDLGLLSATRRRSLCEWKGQAQFYAVTVQDRTIEDAAWAYPCPTVAFASIQGFFAFYPSRMDACFVDDEPARSQEGDFYGGWITSQITGPFKGGPRTLGW